MTPAMKALEERQQNILRRLELLEKEVRGINSQLGRNFGDPAPVEEPSVSSEVCMVKMNVVSIPIIRKSL